TEWLRVSEDRSDATVPVRPGKQQMLWIPIAGRAPRELAAELAPLTARLAEPCAAWLAESSEVFGRTLAPTEALPPAQQFCAMMDGGAIEPGWGHRELRGAGGA